MIAMEFDECKVAIENIDPNDVSKENIKWFVRKHCRVMTHVEKLEKTHSAVFLYNLVQSSVLICCLVLQLSSTDDLSLFMLYFPYLMSSVNQILLLCHLGQKLIDSSQSVADGAFNSKWLEFKSTQVRRTFCFIILRSQRPCKLTAKKFQVISLARFTSVRQKVDVNAI